MSTVYVFKILLPGELNANRVSGYFDWFCKHPANYARVMEHVRLPLCVLIFWSEHVTFQQTVNEQLQF